MLHDSIDFPFDYIIDKFFMNHNDHVGMDLLKKWRGWSKQESFNSETINHICRQFLARRKMILDAEFQWTPANKARIVLFNRAIHNTEFDLYKSLKQLKRNFKEMFKQKHYFVDTYLAQSRIRYTGYYIENEDEDFAQLLWRAIPKSHQCEFVRNTFDSFDNKLVKPTTDWGYDFKENQRECASISEFRKLPLHKHAGFLMFDSQTFALQDFVNMCISFQSCTDITYDNPVRI